MLEQQRWPPIPVSFAAFTASWMAARMTSHTTKTTTTAMSQRPETVVNFNQKPPRKRKAQDLGAQEDQPTPKRQKQVRVSPNANVE